MKTYVSKPYRKLFRNYKNYRVISKELLEICSNIFKKSDVLNITAKNFSEKLFFQTKMNKCTFALLIVGDHQRVKRRFGIWLRPERWAFVNFLNFIDSSNPEARSQKSPSHVGKYVPWKIKIYFQYCYVLLDIYDNDSNNWCKQTLNKVCSRMPSTPPSAWIISVR